MAAAHLEIEKQLAFMKRRDRRDGRGAAGAVGNFNSNFNSNWSVRRKEQGGSKAGAPSAKGASESRSRRGGRNKESSDFNVARNFRNQNQGRR